MSFKSAVLIVMSALFLFSMPSAILAEAVIGTAQINTSDKNTPENTGESALDDARQKIEKAINYYKEGDLDASKHNLDIAIASLKKAAQDSTTEKARDESRKLGIKIDEFKEKLNSASEQHENSLMRFWHQTVSIIKRETDHLIHSYNELSVSEKTLKYLLDAKMHLFIAQHDLFVAHNDEDAINELNNVLDYLDDASQVAKPSIKEKIIKLTKNIQALKRQLHPGQEEWKNNDLVLSLKQAVENLAKAKSIASPQIKLRIESLEAEIQSLRADVEKSNIKHDYELSIVKLKKIINEL